MYGHCDLGVEVVS